MRQRELRAMHTSRQLRRRHQALGHFAISVYRCLMIYQQGHELAMIMIFSRRGFRMNIAVSPRRAILQAYAELMMRRVDGADFSPASDTMIHANNIGRALPMSRA